MRIQQGYSQGTVRIQQGTAGVQWVPVEGTAGWGQCKRTSKHNHLTRITCVALL